MKLSLAEVSGLSSVDPLYGYLQETDNLLQKYKWWSDVRKTEIELVKFVLTFCNVSQDGKEQHKSLEELLVAFKENGEPFLAELVHLLLYRSKMSMKAIRLVIMFICINIEEMKIREAYQFSRKCRSIDD